MITQASSHRQKKWWTHTQRKGQEVTHSRDRCQSENPTDVWKVWIKIQIVMGGKKHPNLLFQGGRDYSDFQGMTRESTETQRTEWKKLIRPSVQTLSTFLSFRGRQTTLGLTRVVITRLQREFDSNMTRMNGLASYPNQDTCCRKNDTFICPIISFSHDQVVQFPRPIILQFFSTCIFLPRYHAIKNLYF